MNLTLYADVGCVTCQRSRVLLDDIAVVYPDLDIHVVEVDETEPLPDEVIAVPTFVLQDQVISMGNPTLEELIAVVEEAVLGNA